MLSNTMRLNFSDLKFIHFLLPRYHPKIIGYIFKNNQTCKRENKRAFIHEILRLIIIKMKIKMKNRSHR